MKKVIIILGLVFMTQCVAFAQEGISIVQDASSDLISVAVDTGVPKASNVVTVRILNSQNADNYITMGYTDATGKFSFSYCNDTQTGRFRVIVRTAEAVMEEEYYKLSATEISDMKNLINQQINASEPNGALVKAVIEKYKASMNIDWTVYQTLTNQDAVYQILVSDTGNRSKISSSNPGVKDIIDAFYRAVVTEKVNENPSSVHTLLLTPVYTEIFGGTSSLLYVQNEKASADMKAAALTKIPKTNTAFSTITENLEFGFLYARILKATHWNDVKTGLADYSEKLNISLTDVSTSVYKNMMNQAYTSYTNCAQAFKALQNSGNKNTSSSSSSSGGGSGVLAGSSVKIEPFEIADTSLQQGSLIFTDMEGAQWAIDAVRYVYEKGIVSGVGDNCFEPNRSITRAEAAKLLVLMAGENTRQAQLPFTDVDSTDWCYPYVATAYQLGIVNGKDADTFGKDETITRQEMALMAWRAMRSMKIEMQSGTAVNFEDKGEISPWAMEAVSALVKMGVVVGVTGENGILFLPTDGITRAEASTVIYNILRKSA